MRRLAPARSSPRPRSPCRSAPQTVDEVIAKNVAARGGLDKVRAVQSLRMTGTVSMGPGDAGAPRPGDQARRRIRIEVTVQGKTGVQTFDGTSGWALMPFMGHTEPQAMPAEAVKDAQEQSDLDGPLVDYQKKGHKVELDRQGQGGRRGRVQAARHAQERVVRDIWIDAASWLEVRGEGSRSMGGRIMEAETTLGDYRDVDGLSCRTASRAGRRAGPEADDHVHEDRGQPRRSTTRASASPRRSRPPTRRSDAKR